MTPNTKLISKEEDINSVLERLPENPFKNMSSYIFCPLPDYKKMQGELHQILDGYRDKDLLRGTILLSSEGMNINMSGSQETLEEVMAKLRGYKPCLKDLYFKVTDGGKAHNYRKMRIRLKEEIVSLKRKDILDKDGKPKAARFTPEEFQNLLEKDPDNVVVVDVRNDYEHSIGHFKGSVMPNIRIFNDFPKWSKEWVEKDPSLKNKTVVTVCTGGIKTEKATLSLLDAGVKKAAMLEGGILDYFKLVDQKRVNSSWDGDCFVYDRRVGVKPDLSESECVLCENCTWPLTKKEQQMKEYIPGKQCHMCVGKPREKKLTVLDIKDDPNAPKRPPSAIQLFLDDHADQPKREMGMKWQQQMTKEDRKPWMDRFNQSMKDYHMEVALFIEKKMAKQMVDEE